MKQFISKLYLINSYVLVIIANTKIHIRFCEVTSTPTPPAYPAHRVDEDVPVLENLIMLLSYCRCNKIRSECLYSYTATLTTVTYI